MEVVILSLKLYYKLPTCKIDVVYDINVNEVKMSMVRCVPTVQVRPLLCVPRMDFVSERSTGCLVPLSFYLLQRDSVTL